MSPLRAAPVVPMLMAVVIALGWVSPAALAGEGATVRAERETWRDRVDRRLDAVQRRVQADRPARLRLEHPRFRERLFDPRHRMPGWHERRLDWHLDRWGDEPMIRRRFDRRPRDPRFEDHRRRHRQPDRHLRERGEAFSNPDQTIYLPRVASLTFARGGEAMAWALARVVETPHARLRVHLRVSNRADQPLRIEPGAVEMLTTDFAPLQVKQVDAPIPMEVPAGEVRRFTVEFGYPPGGPQAVDRRTVNLLMTLNVDDQPLVRSVTFERRW